MKCSRCNKEIPNKSMKCPNCGEEFRMVPDYNPLEEVIAHEVRDSIKSHTGSMRNTSRINEQKRRQQAERKKMLLKKKKRQRLIIILSILGILIFTSVFLYRNSYTGLINRGNKALVSAKYNESIRLFNYAIDKNGERKEAYVGVSDAYIAQDNLDAAEKVLTDAVEEYPSNVSLNEALIEFYIKTSQESKIPVFLSECEDETVLKALEAYVVTLVEYSLEEGTYEDVQELTLTSEGAEIYYTINGSPATINSTKYDGPIQLSEGTTIVRAISLSEDGIPSMEARKEYIVELPIEDAPIVSPSTGQYTSSTSITIQVPDGYTAYYTLNGDTPTENSTKYTGPISMPEGNTIFSAVLINGSGKSSDITKRNYDLEFE